VQTLIITPQRMQAALGDELLATDLAEYLVRRGLPFRQSHELVGRAVKRAELLGVPLSRLPLAEYQAISPEFGEDVYGVFDFGQSVERRDVYGGTSRRAVLEQIGELRSALPDQS